MTRRKGVPGASGPGGTTGPGAAGGAAGQARGGVPARVSWRDRLRYAFDASMSRGTPALIGWLTAATLVLIVVFATINTVFSLRGSADPVQDFPHELFSTLLHALDPGTIGGDTGSWRFLRTMLC